MKHKQCIKRLGACLLALLMILSASLYSAVAEDAPPAAPGEAAEVTPETIPNRLLQAVDLRGSEHFSPELLKHTGGNAEVSDDGTAVRLVTTKVSNSATHSLYWGGLLTNLPLGSGSSYTVTLTIANPKNVQFGIMLDYNGSDPAASTGFSGNFTTINSVAIENADGADGIRYFCMEADGENKELNLYILSGGLYQLVTKVPFPEGKPASDSLGLVFYLFGGRSLTGSVGREISEMTVSDIRIYEGLYRGRMFHDQAPEPDGSLLLEIPDLSKDAFNGASGVGYRQTVGSGNSFYRYDEAHGGMTTVASGKNSTQTYGGTTNLKLNANSKYTISYMATQSKGSGAGVRVSYEKNAKSVGVYAAAGSACLAHGATTTNGYSGYYNYAAGMKQNNTVFWQDGYAKFDIEINGTVISVYVNDVFLLREDITAPSNKTAADNLTKEYMSDTVSIVFHEYFTTNTMQESLSVMFKDLRIYSGLLHQEIYDVEALSAQIGKKENGTYSVRFVGGGTNGIYSRVGFEVTAEYGDSSDRYEYHTVQVYRKLTAPERDESLPPLQADALGCEYLFAYTLYGVPESIGRVTFTIRPFAMKNGNRMVGQAVTFTVENGILK